MQPFAKKVDRVILYVVIPVYLLSSPRRRGPEIKHSSQTLLGPRLRGDDKDGTGMTKDRAGIRRDADDKI